VTAGTPASAASRSVHIARASTDVGSMTRVNAASSNCPPAASGRLPRAGDDRQVRRVDLTGKFGWFHAPPTRR
jgi:hypothetical protein